MHYRNGKEARVGDKVVGRDLGGQPLAGTVVETQGGSDTCNLQIVPWTTPTWTATAANCLLVDDAFALPAN